VAYETASTQPQYHPTDTSDAPVNVEAPDTRVKKILRSIIYKTHIKFRRSTLMQTFSRH